MPHETLNGCKNLTVTPEEKRTQQKKTRDGKKYKVMKVQYGRYKIMTTWKDRLTPFQVHTYTLPHAKYLLGIIHDKRSVIVQRKRRKRKKQDRERRKWKGDLKARQRKEK